ncbi:glycerol-3-phosphate phosphatase [Glossina fuscipes]|uniref:Glycerol-3-phosphate phosphatase n=1 Tax=Glossina fuscipes TaxID=7396 RepID=A0A9C6DYN6_9MUSC|nr:glycerol-3-phosphate phosphatase [Glossina fuscipes]KAI9589054.1 hypothetical protein GQX74_007223 [Glossina fuscipes]
MSTPIHVRNILDLSSEEKVKFLESFDHVFSDIDGVVWNARTIIAGSGDGFAELRKAGKKITFITNNSVRTEEACLEKLRNNNIEIDANHLMHPAKSTVEYLKNINFQGLIYIIASDAFKSVLRKEGFQLKDGPNVILDESFSQLMQYVMDREPIKAVIIDFDFNLSLCKMMKAVHYARQSDCLLIGGATDIALPISKDMTIMGAGVFVKAFEQAAKREMLVFGKPSEALANVLLKRYNIEKRERVLMIGDMLEQDIRFGKTSGFQTLLVLSGGCSMSELRGESDRNAIPDYYANSMKDFVDFMKELNK